MSFPFNSSPFLTIHNAAIQRSGQAILSGLDWEIKKDQHWAVVGPNGSGKTTLLEAIAGKIPLMQGHIEYSFMQNKRSQDSELPGKYAWEYIQFVPGSYSFSRLSHSREHYYQQRFHSFETEDFPRVEDFLLADLPFEEANETRKGEKRQQLDKIAGLLGVAHLLDRRVVQLSNGETKRILITHALLAQPELLLLDNPFVGLDTQTRQALQEVINEITRLGAQVILASSPADIPGSITHVLEIEQGKVTGQYDREVFRKKWKMDSGASTSIQEDNAQPIRSLPLLEEIPAFRLVVEMKNVNVTYGEVKVLTGIGWVVKQGEKWALLGPNGSGKSTLLSLINGDNPQAYANDIVLFDRKKGSGESIWDIKKKIGYVSPELHAYFPRLTTIFRVVASGFFDTIGLNKDCTADQAEIIRIYLSVLGIDHSEDTLFNRLSAGEQRLVLLARALVKNPPLLIMDEPCQGLDEEHVNRFKTLVDETCNYSRKTLIYVTHYAHEIPGCVTKVLRLDKGKVVTVGKTL